MSGSALLRGRDQSPSRFWRFLFITLVFLLLRPPIFGIAGWLMKFDLGLPLFGWLVAIAIYSYPLCAPSALVAGLIHEATAIKFGQNSVWVPIATAGVAALVAIVVIALAFDAFGDAFRAPTESYAIFLFASLMASLICWRLTRNFARSV